MESELPKNDENNREEHGEPELSVETFSGENPYEVSRNDRKYLQEKARDCSNESDVRCSPRCSDKNSFKED